MMFFILVVIALVLLVVIVIIQLFLRRHINRFLIVVVVLVVVVVVNDDVRLAGMLAVRGFDLQLSAIDRLEFHLIRNEDFAALLLTRYAVGEQRLSYRRRRLARAQRRRRGLRGIDGVAADVRRSRAMTRTQMRIPIFRDGKRLIT